MERIQRRTAPKKDLNELDTTIMCSIIQSQTFWSMRSNGPQETLLSISGCDGNPVQLFKTLKDDAIRVLHIICQQFERPSSGHRTGKGQSSSELPRRAELKNVQTTGQLHSSPMLVRSCLKSCRLGFSIMQTKNFQTSKLGLEKVEQEIKLPTFTGSQRKQGNSRKTSTSVSSTTL